MSNSNKPKKEVKRKNFIFRMNDTDRNRLDRVSEDMHMSKSDTIRTLIENYEKSMK